MTGIVRRFAIRRPTLLRAAQRVRAWELLVVKVVARSAERPVLGQLAVAITKLGNGWIYPAIAAAVVVRWGLPALRMVTAALATAAILHALYPPIKRYFMRARPYVADRELRCLSVPLDPYSFPSGHTMTFAGVSASLVYFWHAASPVCIAMGLCLAWSRLATAHHYPSDVLAGAALGVGVGIPVAAFTELVL